MDMGGLMKKLLCIGLSLIVTTSFYSCSSESSVNTDEQLSQSVEKDYISDDKSYTQILFKDIPDDITSEYTGDTKEVEISGYLSNNLSKDGSVGYLWDNGYGSIPLIDEDNVGKCVVLDLSRLDMDINDMGDNFITVSGTIVTDSFIDVYNIKSLWHISVDSINIMQELPDNVDEYRKYMDSFEFEAFAKLIDYIGNAVYAWSQDDSLVELNIEDIGCDYTEMIKGTKENYPNIYNEISEYLDIFTEYYVEISENVTEQKRPDDIQSYYDGIYKYYPELSDKLVLFGNFE